MKRYPTQETLVKEVHRVLDNPFWIPSLNADEVYSRTHDDHDGTFTGRLNISIDRMGDVWILVADEPPLRFRTFGGGGMSPRTRNALMILAEAIRLDNIEKPEAR